MADCCEDKACEITALREKHKRILVIVLAINAMMFFIEGAYGWVSHSTALMADALDMLGDAMVYAMSLYVLAKSARQQARVSLFKGIFMLMFGVMVLAEAAYKMFYPVMPDVGIMGVVGFIALAANVTCFLLLYTHRADSLNMSSTWLCSRNDLIANTGVLFAALLSYLVGLGWPDIVIGLLIAAVFLKSAISVIQQSIIELRRNA